MKRLVILTKKFGNNFTGATMTTQMLLSYWANEFEIIEVLTLEKGNYSNYSNINVYEFQSIRDLWRKLKESYNYEKDTSYYSDDHLGFLFGILKKDYIHTYHGNWPDARWINWNFFLKSFYFIPLYILTIMKAKSVVNVSYYMEKFTNKYNSNTLVIRNGVNLERDGKQDSSTFKSSVFTVIMMGNIDKRKYLYLDKLLTYLSKENYLDFKCDIYGSIIDKQLANTLEKDSRVSIKGFQNEVPWENYDCLLSTSTSENLPISIVEALKKKIKVVAFSSGGIKEVVINHDNGYICQNKNFIELANCLKDLASMKKVCVDFPFTISDARLYEFEWQIAAIRYLYCFSNN